MSLVTLRGLEPDVLEQVVKMVDLYYRKGIRDALLTLREELPDDDPKKKKLISIDELGNLIDAMLGDLEYTIRSDERHIFPLNNLRKALEDHFSKDPEKEKGPA